MMEKDIHLQGEKKEEGADTPSSSITSSSVS